MDRKQVEVSGATIFGDPRRYVVGVMLAKQSLKMFHDYFSIVMNSWDTLKPLFDLFPAPGVDAKGIKLDVSKLIPALQLLPRFITFDRMMDLLRELCPGMKIEGCDLGEDGAVVSTIDTSCDDEGMCELFGQDPMEVMTALFWALSVNYPKYFLPFLQDSAGK